MPSFPTGFPKMERKEKKPPNTVEIFEILALKLDQDNCIVSLFFERENAEGSL